MTDLVKRLREEDVYDYDAANELCNEAADYIEEQQKRIERLEKRNKELEEALCDIEDAPMEWSSTALSKMAGAALKGKKYD